MNMFIFCIVIAFTVYSVSGSEQRQDQSSAPEKDVCQLPVESGPCYGSFPRYYYNKKTGTCEEFVYGGCEGNGNRFDSKEKCVATCCKASAPEKDVCQLPVESGPCYGSFPRYYYNKKTGTCEEFIYGGCEGNGNRFDSKEKCVATCCKGPPQGDVCKLPYETGPCEAYIHRFFFNLDDRTCKEFIYGGCGGNGNNFETEAECIKKCGTPPKCPKDQKYYECMPTCNTCENYGKNILCRVLCREGCYCDEKHLMTKDKTCVKKEECGQETDVCKLPYITGPCKAYMPRFYFNVTERKCKKFIYGGCNDNGNNFETIEECMEKCENYLWKNVCKLPSDTGPCKASFTRYFYNTDSKRCEMFSYGGCAGNDNRFYSEKECMEKCGKKLVNRKCKLPPKRGPCNGRHIRYYYNTKLGKCVKFFYGGCHGNCNNFKTEEECLKKCIICPPNSEYELSGPACEGCGIRCLAIINEPKCYCKDGYGRENANSSCIKCNEKS